MMMFLLLFFCLVSSANAEPSVSQQNISSLNISNGPMLENVIASSVAASKVVALQVEDDSLGATDIGDGLGLTEIDETAFQRRVTGTCSGNNFVQSIAEAGTVACGAGGAGANLPQSISLGGNTVLTNVGTTYDAVSVSSGMGIAFVDFDGVAAIDWYISIRS